MVGSPGGAGSGTRVPPAPLGDPLAGRRSGMVQKVGDGAVGGAEGEFHVVVPLLEVDERKGDRILAVGFVGHRLGDALLMAVVKASGERRLAMRIRRTVDALVWGSE